MRGLYFLIFLHSGAAVAQTAPTALPMLEVPAQPALGGAGVGRGGADPLLFLQNPASLGLATASARVAHVPSSTWFGDVRYGVDVATAGRSVGPLALGIGLADGAMVGAARTLADGTLYQPADRFRALGAALATRGAVRLSGGATARFVTATDAPVWTGQSYAVGRLRGVTLDVGATLAADVAALAGRPSVGPLQPSLDVTVGVAQTHWSGAIQYSGFSPRATPRTAALGWSVRAGLDPLRSSRPLRLVEAELAVQAEQSLVRSSEAGFVYASALDGPSVRSVAFGTGTASTTGRRGVRLTVLETLTLSWGRFDGWGYADARTHSVEVGSRALVAALAPVPLARRLEPFDLRLGWTTVFAGSDHETRRASVRLVVGR